VECEEGEDIQLGVQVDAGGIEGCGKQIESFTPHSAVRRASGLAGCRKWQFRISLQSCAATG